MQIPLDSNSGGRKKETREKKKAEDQSEFMKSVEGNQQTKVWIKMIIGLKTSVKG